MYGKWKKWENIQFNVYTMYNYVIPCVTVSDAGYNERREVYNKNNNSAEKKGNTRMSIAFYSI